MWWLIGLVVVIVLVAAFFWPYSEGNITDVDAE